MFLWYGAKQMQRMEDMNCEVVPFEDVLCQMSVHALPCTCTSPSPWCLLLAWVCFPRLSLSSWCMCLPAGADTSCCRSDLLQPDVEGEFRMKDFLHPTRVRLTGTSFVSVFFLVFRPAWVPFTCLADNVPRFTAPGCCLCVCGSPRPGAVCVSVVCMCAPQASFLASCQTCPSSPRSNSVIRLS